MYVDDLLTGANSIEEVRSIRNEIISLLSRGGFSIRQWASNDTRMIHDLSNNTLHANYALENNRSMKTLGILWNICDDKLHYSVQPVKTIGIVTKGKILSEVAKIYDPMGLMGPVILYAKQLLQNLWRCGTHWDESVPQNIFTMWSEFTKQLESIHQISFDRRLFRNESGKFQIHGFCDASNRKGS